MTTALLGAAALTAALGFASLAGAVPGQHGPAGARSARRAEPQALASSPSTEAPTASSSSTTRPAPPPSSPDHVDAASGPRSSIDNPFRGRRLFVDPGSEPALDAAAIEATDPAGAAALRVIAAQSRADWFGDWHPASRVGATVAQRVAEIEAVGAFPVLVLYAIPGRDCGGHSSGGVGDESGYRAWIRAVAAGLDRRPAAVILEPDALAQLGCLSGPAQRSRLALLNDAVDVLTASGAAVYLDAGNAGWIGASTMAERLAAAGVARARGFALNVSNFGRTDDEVAYGRVLSAALDGKPMVVDTSRNGAGRMAGPDGWCNPQGRALGRVPTVDTGDPVVDAYLWVKHPGRSDGTCNGGPPAGQWWRAAAIALAQTTPG